LSLEEWRESSARSAFVHPDDRTREHDQAGRESPYTLELRLRKADGSYRWFLAQYNPVRDDDGQIIRWHIACTDIDDRKRAEPMTSAAGVAGFPHCVPNERAALSSASVAAWCRYPSASYPTTVTAGACMRMTRHAPKPMPSQ